MRKIVLIIVGLIAFTLTLTLTLALTSKQEPVQSPSDKLEDCNTPINNGLPDNKIDLLFFANKQITEDYFAYLFSTSPFKEYEDRFNVHYLDVPVSCKRYQDIAVFCYSKETLKKAASCQHDVIIALTEDNEDIRASAYHNVISLNTRLPKEVLLHELGHTQPFNLDEEYLANYNPPLSSPNCKKSCESFGSSPLECFEECSSGSYKRSVFNGIMRTLSPENPEIPFGKYNTEIMQGALEKYTFSPSETITGQVSSEPASCLGQNYILLEISYSSSLNKIEVTNKEAFVGCAMGQLTGPISYEVNGVSGVISRGAFDPVNTFTDKPEQDLSLGGETYIYEGKLYLAVNQDQTPQSINFLDSEGKNIGSTSLNDLGARPCPI